MLLQGTSPSKLHRATRIKASFKQKKSSMVALNRVDLAQLELHFLEFPFLSVSILEVGTRDISVRLAGQK